MLVCLDGKQHESSCRMPQPPIAMLALDRYNDPFSLESLLSLPSLPIHASSAWQALDLDQHDISGIFGPSDTKRQELQELCSDYFHLQVHDVPLPDIESSNGSSILAGFDDITATSDTKTNLPGYEGDVWSLPDVIRTSDLHCTG